MTEWMNEWMNETMNETMKKWKRMNEYEWNNEKEGLCYSAPGG